MNGETSIGGVFVPTLMIWCLLAMFITILVRRLLLIIGFYRFVWHQALFDLAMFVVIWGALAASFSSTGLAA